jgi:predicted Fe-Mo cluster-binding NifX family protein
MKLAIPELNGRVSPTFDFCRNLLFVELSSGESPRITDLDLSGLQGCQRACFLKTLKIEILLCGGISKDLEEDVREHGVQVVPWLSGDIMEVLGAYLEDKLPDPRLTLPSRTASRKTIFPK